MFEVENDPGEYVLDRQFLFGYLENQINYILQDQ